MRRNTDENRLPTFPASKIHWSAHRLLLDRRKRVSVTELDFRPDRDDQPVTKYRSEDRPAAAGSAGSTTLAKRAFDAAWRITGLQHRRKDYCDTGTRFYWRYRRDRGHPFELAVPVLRLPAESPVQLSWRGRLLESMLPDSLCYLPKRRDSYTGVGLREAGYLQDAPAVWEEFMWQGVPFGFHVRRNRDKGIRDEKPS